MIKGLRCLLLFSSCHYYFVSFTAIRIFLYSHEVKKDMQLLLCNKHIDIIIFCYKYDAVMVELVNLYVEFIQEILCKSKAPCG